MSIAALLPDGITFTWLPYVYGTDTNAVHTWGCVAPVGCRRFSRRCILVRQQTKNDLKRPKKHRLEVARGVIHSKLLSQMHAELLFGP